MKLIITSLFSIFFLSQFALAAPKEESAKTKKEIEDKERKLPKSGNLAGSYNNRKDGVQVAETWNDDTGEAAPLSAAINSKGNGQWEAVVTNSSEDTYYGYFEIAFLNDRGTKIKSSPFVATLKPKDTAKQSVMGPPENANVEVNLISWKNLSKKKKVENKDSSNSQTREVASDSNSVASDEPVSDANTQYNSEGR